MFKIMCKEFASSGVPLIFERKAEEYGRGTLSAWQGDETYTPKVPDEKKPGKPKPAKTSIRTASIH